MKKTLSLILALALVAALAVGVLADEPADVEGGIMPISDSIPVEEIDAPIPRSFVGDITVDGEALNLTNVPGAPAGYIPMRLFCDAMGAYVDWFAEDNEAFFTVDGLGVVVNLNDLSVTKDFEPVEGVKAYLDPTGFTFLPVSFLTTFPNIKVDDHPEMDSIHFDFTTKPERSALETVADAIVETAQVGATIQLDMETAAGFGVAEENYVELVALYPMMSANPSSLYLAEVAEGKMDAAKANFAEIVDMMMANFGNYPASAEMINAGKVVESPDGSHLMLLIASDVDAGVAAFEAAFPARER